MVMNDSAYYEGKLWCAYELKNRDGSYDEELRLHMRKESQSNKFQCPDCGENLILCAGPVMEPFFKHHEGSACVESRESGGKTEFVARRILYHLAKDSFPQAEILVYPKIQTGIRPTIWIASGEKRIALKYLSSDMKLLEWEKEHAFYEDNGIKDIWFLNKSRYYEDRLTTFEYLLSKTELPLKLIDAANNQMVLKEKCETRISKREMIVSRAYPLEEIRITQEGEVISDFAQYRAGILDGANRAEKLFMQHQEEELLIRQQQIEEKNRRQQEAYLEQIRLRKEEQKKQEEKEALVEVKRSLLSQENNLAGKMRMTSLGEAWELPQLKGKDWQVREANNQRFTYLKRLDKQLKDIMDSNIRNLKIEEASQKLRINIQASSWTRR